MNDLIDFFSSFEEPVYICDLATYEILYMNETCIKACGNEFLNYHHQMCYQVIFNQTNPCEFCKMKKIAKGKFEKMEIYNQINQHFYKLNTTLIKYNGKLCLLNIATNLSENDIKIQTINNYVNNEKIINDALKVSLNYINPDESINKLLEYLGQIYQCDRVYIFEKNKTNGIDNTFEWCKENITSEIDSLQNISLEDAQFWFRQFEENDNLIIKDLEEYKKFDPVVYDILYTQNIHSLIASPLFFNNEIIGFYGVDNPPKENLENISVLLKILGYFIVSLLGRKKTYDKMKLLSHYDQLTKFGNRFYLDEYVDTLPRNKSIGIIYCDILGLKKTNDTFGHKVGDDLIVKICSYINNFFIEEKKFRIGGDEFIIICPNMTKIKFDKLVMKFKDMILDEVLYLSIGSHWNEKFDCTFDKLLIKADNDMYLDKKKYYVNK